MQSFERVEIIARLTLICSLGIVVPAFAQEEDATTLSESGKAALLHKEDKAYLLRHNPFYFAYGNPSSKLQLSFRTQLIKQWPIYFAYTQLMFWAMNQESKPFHDLSFRPEFFYRYELRAFKTLKSVDFGWMHESNGKSGDDSRSYNSIYARLNAEREFSNWIVRASLIGAYHHAFDNTNADLFNYLGPLNLKVSFIQLWKAWVDKSEFALQAVPAGKFAQNWNHGGYQISWSFRLGKLDLVPSLYMQYYTGYAESLLNYNQYVHAFRVGVIF